MSRKLEPPSSGSSCVYELSNASSASTVSNVRSAMAHTKTRLTFLIMTISPGRISALEAHTQTEQIAATVTLALVDGAVARVAQIYFVCQVVAVQVHRHGRTAEVIWQLVGNGQIHALLLTPHFVGTFDRRNPLVAVLVIQAT